MKKYQTIPKSKEPKKKGKKFNVLNILVMFFTLPFYPKMTKRDQKSLVIRKTNKVSRVDLQNIPALKPNQTLH